MDRGQHSLRQGRFNPFSAMLRHPKCPAQQRLGCRGPKTYDHLRMQHRNFRLQPGTARRDITRARSLVDAPLPARLPLEMFHRVGDVDRAAIDTGFLERDDVFGIVKPQAATIGTRIRLVRLPGNPPTQCLSTTVECPQ